MEAVISESLLEKKKSSFDMLNRNWVFILIFRDIISSLLICIIHCILYYRICSLAHCILCRLQIFFGGGGDLNHSIFPLKCDPWKHLRCYSKSDMISHLCKLIVQTSGKSSCLIFDALVAPSVLLLRW